MKPLKLKSPTKGYPWGGRRLAEEFDIESSFDTLAEAWVLACHPDGMSVISSGEYAGMTLEEYIKLKGRRVLGEKSRKYDFFPLLIKLIDARDDLSLQVHPSDEYALKNEGQYGKTEAWYILDCDEGAQILYGLKEDMTREELREAVNNDDMLSRVNHIPVKKGDFFFIPSGTLHAICKGILVYEIQQNSNLTYRVYDYDRRPGGSPRPLHKEKAGDVINIEASSAESVYDSDPRPIPGGTVTLLKKCSLFSLKRYDVETDCEIEVDDSSFVSLTAVEGNGVLTCGDTCLTLYKGESVFLPAGLGTVTVSGSVCVMAGSVE